MLISPRRNDMTTAKQNYNQSVSDFKALWAQLPSNLQDQE